MANLFEINTQLTECWNNCFDAETGEINEELYAQFESLEMARDEKVENIALWIKNLKSDAEAFKAEKNAFAEREKAAKAKAESLTNYLTTALAGEKFSTTKVAISYRKSEAVNILDASVLPDQYLTYKEPEPDKTAIKKAIKDGTSVPGAELQERQNIQIK